MAARGFGAQVSIRFSNAHDLDFLTVPGLFKKAVYVPVHQTNDSNSERRALLRRRSLRENYNRGEYITEKRGTCDSVQKDSSRTVMGVWQTLAFAKRARAICRKHDCPSVHC